MVYFIITVFSSMFVSALCSLFEACLLSISHNDIAEMSMKTPGIAKIWKNFKANIQKPIAVILIINTIAHTLGASLSGAQFDKLFGSKWILIFSFVFSFAMIQWTEILPKTLGVKYNKRIARIIPVPLLVTLKIFAPLVKLIEIINLPFVGKKMEAEENNIVNEISVLSRFAFNSSLITKDQENFITRTINVSSIKASDIMIPKKDIKFLTTNMTMMEALIEAHIHNHTRFPLINSEDQNDVLGYINFKDIVSALQINPKNPSLKGIVRPIITIFEDDTYPNIFKKVSSHHQHITIVKDRHNNLKGIITLEDLIEEIIGDIEDEYDVLQTHLFPIAASRYIIGGGVKIEHINQECNLNLPDKELSLHEWIIKNYGKEIRSGKKCEINEVTLIVKKVRRGKIREVILEKQPIFKTGNKDM